MKTPVPHAVRHFHLAACCVAAAMLAACQKSPESAPTQTPAFAVPAPVTILGGLQPGDTVSVVNCSEPQPGTCSIAVVATAPAGGTGDGCTVAVASAVSLPKTTATLRWQLQTSDTTHNFRFRAAAGTEKPGFGVRLIDNDIYAPEPAASSPMRPIWVPQVTEPGLVEMSRTVRSWPPRISAYDLYLDYQAKGAKDWTACKTWDPIIVNRD